MKKISPGSHVKMELENIFSEANIRLVMSRQAFTYSKSIIETLKHDMKSVQS